MIVLTRLFLCALVTCGMSLAGSHTNQTYTTGPHTTLTQAEKQEARMLKLALDSQKKLFLAAQETTTSTAIYHYKQIIGAKLPIYPEHVSQTSTRLLETSPETLLYSHDNFFHLLIPHLQLMSEQIKPETLLAEADVLSQHLSEALQCEKNITEGFKVKKRSIRSFRGGKHQLVFR